MAGQIDFNKLAGEPRFEAILIDEARADRRLRTLRLGGAIFVIAAVTLASLGIVGLGNDPESKKNAWILLQTIVGGVIGFWAGQRDDRP